MIDTLSKEMIQDSEMTQVENEVVVMYEKINKYSNWSDKSLQIYKHKEKIELLTKIRIPVCDRRVTLLPA